MIIQCLKDIRCLKEGKSYLAFESTISKIKKNNYYRIVSENGTLALYESEYFIVVNEYLDNMVFEETDSSIVIQLKKIKNLADECFHIDGIWGEYFDKENKELINNIHEILKIEAQFEGIEIPEPIAY